MICVREYNQEKKAMVSKKIEKTDTIINDYIIPRRPVQDALDAIKKDHEKNEHYKNDDEEAAGYDALVKRVIREVEDSKKKKIEIPEIQTLTRKSDLKKLER